MRWQARFQYSLRRKASYTVEAAFITPILVLLICGVLNRSIQLYEKTEDLRLNCETTETFDSLKLFCYSQELDAVKKIIFAGKE